MHILLLPPCQERFVLPMVMLAMRMASTSTLPIRSASLSWQRIFGGDTGPQIQRKMLEGLSTANLQTCVVAAYIRISLIGNGWHLQATPAKERVKRWTKKELKMFEESFVSLGHSRTREAMEMVRFPGKHTRPEQYTDAHGGMQAVKPKAQVPGLHASYAPSCEHIDQSA